MNITHEKTKEILHWFEEISKIPRCSKCEAAICQWLIDWAEAHDFEVKKDKIENILISVPASPGYEASGTVVIQGHMDMVCEKTTDSSHDFSKDPIRLVYDGEWLTAADTSLGSDNGIAIAMALVAALDPELPHPPLELLFTVDEETGLTGANELQPGFITGKILLNIDSEDEGVFTVGCAGGVDTELSLPLAFETIPQGFSGYKIIAGGMKGGHSGIDINVGKANAIKVLGRVLNELIKLGIDLRILNIQGGSAHNAIPRDAHALVCFPSNAHDKVKQIIKDFSETLISEYKSVDPDINVTLEEADSASDQAVSKADTLKLVEYTHVVPHGVSAMSPDIENLVETSNNLATIKIESNELQMLTSQRSSVVSRLENLTHSIEATARVAGGSGKSGEGYPPWQPNMDSPLLKRCVEVYKKLFNKEPVVEVIHAGLECGIIGDKYPGMDMISFGPTLKYPHSPDEKIHIGAIGLVWDFMAELLKALK